MASKKEVQMCNSDVSELRRLNRKFQICCKQVVLLNNEIENLQQRMDVATKQQRPVFLYMLKLRLASVEGIRNAFFDYACARATDLDNIHNQLVDQGLIDEDLSLEELV